MNKELPKSTKVVVIGGGVAGTSCAYHLAKFGWKDVVLLERDQLTSGTTWHAAGLLGQLGATSTITKLRKYSLDLYKELEKRGIAKLTVLPKLGCEGLSSMLYKYMNGVFIPDMWGPGEAERLWCYRVEVRETQSNMAWREGHREWGEDLFDM